MQKQRIRHRSRNAAFSVCKDYHAGISAAVFGVPYCVFQMPLRIRRSDAELSTLYADIYRQILPPEKFQKHIEIHCECVKS